MVFPTKYDYISDVPPTKRVPGHFNISFPVLDIKVNVTINKIYDINPGKASFSTIFSVVIEWYDLNLEFLYLKKDKIGNSIDSTSWDKMWKPNVQFSILSGTPVFPKILDEERLIIRNSTPALSSDVDYLYHNETFPGDQNSIYWRQIVQGTFVCDFNGIAMYPVGTNNCTVTIYLQGVANKMTNFAKPSIYNAQPNKVGEFIIKNISIFESEKAGINGIIINVELLRSTFSIFMVTYVPTILMNMINQVIYSITSSVYKPICVREQST